MLARRLAGRCIYWATVECSRRQDWEGDANVVRRIHFSALVKKKQSGVVPCHQNARQPRPSHAAQTSHAQREDVSFLAARPDSVVLVADRRVWIKKILVGGENR